MKELFEKVERRVLARLARCGGEYAYSFAAIAHSTDIPDEYVRAACRQLKRQGLAEYVSPLFDDDGVPCGAGYRVTAKGLEAFKRVVLPPPE